MHCTENPIYVLPEMKLRDLVSSSYIHVTVSDLYIPMIGLPIWLQTKLVGLDFKLSDWKLCNLTLPEFWKLA